MFTMPSMSAHMAMTSASAATEFIGRATTKIAGAETRHLCLSEIRAGS